MRVAVTGAHGKVGRATVRALQAAGHEVTAIDLTRPVHERAAVPGFFFPDRPFLPDYVPVDEEHPARPQDPYALAKHFGEQLMDAAVRRCAARLYGDAVEVRPHDRVDASAISCEKAVRLLGWRPKRSWRDYLDEEGHTH
ncbi:NAD-dependent epimerase/dehydratase family protein [Nonomuraea sp. NPDC003804]|uniref:NAD-dependent epimerase/dehydratase family protein n=1 Tax=Nonomuraea sp. NPDC003804 TaxID=3154547 RepID=UPI0033B8BE66